MNKMYKSLLFCVIAIVACAMTGCLDNVHSDFTPRILVSRLYVNPYYENDTLCARDTLDIRYDDKQKRFVSDTMQLGDTLTFGVAFSSEGNNLVSSRINWDSTAVQAWFGINANIKSILPDTTTISTGYLRYNPGYSVVSFPVYLVPKKSGSHVIEMTVETDSKYSPVSESFDLVVK